MLLSLPVAINPFQSQPIPAWIWVMLIAAGTIATVTDLRAMRIPNWLTLPLLFGGLAFGTAAGGVDGLTNAFVGAIAAGAIFVVAYAALGGGAGDAKLMLAFGSWIGLEASVALVLFVTSAGFVTAAAIIVSRHGLRATPGIIGVIMFRTAIGVALLRKGVTADPQPAASDDPSKDLSNDLSNEESAGDLDSRTSRSAGVRPKGWFPYAPSILAGTVMAWIFLDVFGGFG